MSEKLVRGTFVNYDYVLMEFWSPALILCLCLCLCLCSLRSINYLSEATDFGVCGGGPTTWIYVYVQLSIINAAAASKT